MRRVLSLGPEKQAGKLSSVARHLSWPLEGGIGIEMTHRPFPQIERMPCVKCGRWLNLYKMIWWNNLIWQETPHDCNWILLLLAAYILKGILKVQCRWVMGVVYLGPKIKHVPFRTKTFPSHFSTSVLLHFSICKLEACLQFLVWVTFFFFFQTATMTTTEVDSSR